MSALLAAARRRRAESPATDAEAGVAMLMVIMLMLVIASLGLVITASVVQQVRPTVFGQKSTRTIFAAEAGIQAGLTQVRTATRRPDAAGVVRGEPTELPCTLSAEAGLPGEQLRYDVALTYFAEDPVGKDAQWREANDLECTAGSGVEVAPAYALVTARGSAQGLPGFATEAGDRQLESIYRFQLVYANIPGGLMFTFRRGYCLEAVSATVGSKVRYVAADKCVSEAPLQSWAYDTDYAIKLADTVEHPDPGLCLEGALGGSNDVTLQKCVKGAARQLFSYHGGGLFRQQNADNTNYAGTCINSGHGGVSDGALLRAGAHCDHYNTDQGAWAPEYKVGAGAASKQTNQLVNFGEFGRCFDITEQNANSQYMILYPCKQDPSPGGTRVLWNHKVYYDETSDLQQLVVIDEEHNNKKHCLVSPNAGVSPAYVRLATCTPNNEAQQWTRNFATGTRLTSYTFVDHLGRCLAAGPKAPASYLAAFSTVVVTTCTGGSEQKWNAPSNGEDAQVTDTRETVRTALPAGP